MSSSANLEKTAAPAARVEGSVRDKARCFLPRVEGRDSANGNSCHTPWPLVPSTWLRSQSNHQKTFRLVPLTPELVLILTLQNIVISLTSFNSFGILHFITNNSRLPHALPRQYNSRRKSNAVWHTSRCLNQGLLIPK